MEDEKPASSPTIEERPQGDEVPVDETEALDMGDQPAPNPTAELQGDEQVYDIVPVDEFQDPQVGDQHSSNPTAEVQGDEQVYDIVPIDEVKDPEMGGQHASDITIEIGGDEFWPLAGKPFFDVIIAKSHVKPLYQMVIPAKIHHTLPSLSIPSVLKFRGKEWEMVYKGAGQKRFDANWRSFVIDNNLKIGDACVFDLQECSSARLVFRVQILRGDIPAELAMIDGGETEKAPLMLLE